MAYKQEPGRAPINAYGPLKEMGLISEEQSLDFGPGDRKKSFKSCNGFYKNGQCYRDRAAYREQKRWNKSKRR